MKHGSQYDPFSSAEHRLRFQKEEIMSKRTIGYVLILLGVIILVLSLAADAIGIGGSPGIGWKQLTGAAVGLLVALGGLYLTFK